MTPAGICKLTEAETYVGGGRPTLAITLFDGRRLLSPDPERSPASAPMPNIGKYRSLSDTIAAQPVSDEAPGLVPADCAGHPGAGSAERGGCQAIFQAVAAWNAMLIHCAPQIVQHALGCG